MVAEKSSKTHYMQLISDTDPNITCCDCINWKHHALPCKHLLVVLLHGEQCSGWDILPEFYRNVPQFNLDPNIVESAPQRAENATAATSNVPIAQEGDLPSDDIGMQDSDSQSIVDETKASVTSFQSQLRQTLSSITGLTYTITNVGFTKKALDIFREHAKQFAAHCDTPTAVLFRRGMQMNCATEHRTFTCAATIDRYTCETHGQKKTTTVEEIMCTW